MSCLPWGVGEQAETGQTHRLKCFSIVKINDDLDCSFGSCSQGQSIGPFCSVVFTLNIPHTFPGSFEYSYPHAVQLTLHMGRTARMLSEEGSIPSSEQNIDVACNSFSFAITLLGGSITLWWHVSLFPKNFHQAI